ncbi:MAG: hypothetical protein ACOVNO_09810 [Sediminibacterium sp.]
MNEQEKQKLLLKKQQILDKIAIEKQSSFLANWWIEVANSIKEAGLNWSLEYLEVVMQQQYDFWIEKLNQDPWSSFSFSESVIQIGDKYWVHEMLYLNYPSILPLRYLPENSTVIQEEANLKIHLKAIIDANELKNQVIFLFYVRMSPVIKINLTDLLQLNLEEILPEQEDVAIMAVNGSWLIFKSMEGEWVCGRQ